MHRLHLGEIHDAVLGAEAGELPHRLAVGAAGVGIADMRTEEVAHPPPRLRAAVKAIAAPQASPEAI
jgi:hypothetical protein